MLIVVCDPTEEVVRAAVEAGAAVLAVVGQEETARRPPSDELLELLQEVFWVRSLDALEQICEVAAEITARGDLIYRVLAFSERAQEPAAVLAALLSVDDAGRLRRTTATRDKRVMKARAEEAGVAVARLRSLGRAEDPAAVHAAVRDLRFPLVLKPAAGQGAMNTELVRSMEELDKSLRDLELHPWIRGRHLVVEEFVKGEEFHVDAVWSRGEPVLFAISLYTVPRIQINGTFPGNSSHIMPPDEHSGLYAEVLALHRRVNDAYGVSDGPTHLEFFRSSDSALTFSEVALRPGGAAIVPALADAFDTDIVDLAVAALLHDGPEPLPARRMVPDRVCGWVNLGPPHDGLIVALPSLEDLQALPFITSVRILREVGEHMVVHDPSMYSILLAVRGGSERDLREHFSFLEEGFPVQVAAQE